MHKTEHQCTTGFARLVNAILKALKDSSCTGRLKIKDKSKLSINLALVASCIRTAYLVDAFTPSDHVSFWQELLQKLRSCTLTSFAFTSVIHIFEPASEQSFIVNLSMIPQLLFKLGLTLLKDQDLESNQNEYPVFVQIRRNQTFQLLDALPLPLFQLLDSWDQTLSPSISSPGISQPLTHTVLPHLPPSLSVPLAAILLDFSVAYVPEEESASGSATATSYPFSGVLMHFFECILSFREEAQFKSSHSSNITRNQRIVHGDVKNCTIMKFSCPDSGQSTLHPEKIAGHLDDLFTRRLKSIGDPTLLKVEIRQTTQTLDRLAF